MLTLLVKDFKLLFGKEKRLSKRIVSTLITLFFIACFITIEVFLFTTILKKINQFYQAPLAFMNLFLAIISILIMVSNLFNARKLFFDEKDIEQLSVHPIGNGAIIGSKLIFLLLTHYAMSILFIYPLFVAYGVIFNKGIWFYYLGLFYPLLSFLFEGGIALLLVYPLWITQKFLKKHLLVQFILAIVLLFVGCYLYSNVLNLFINMIASNNINSLFTKDSVDRFIQMRKYEIPTNFLTDIFVERRYSRLFPYLAIAVGVFLLGISVAIFAFHYVRNISIASKTKPAKESYKPTTVTKALIQKEVLLLTRNTSYTLSFTGLLLVQPFLAYLVIKALNTIFMTGKFAYYIAMLPNFIPLLDILILMLFSVIIAQGASQYISMEKKTIKLMKTIPVDYKKQILIKVLIPFMMSVASLLVSLIVLWIGHVIHFSTVIFGLIMVVLLLIIFDIIALKEELCIRNRKPRSYFASTLYAYVLPIIYFVVTIILSYFKLPIYLAYMMGIVAMLIIGLPYMLYVKKNMASFFMDLDVVN